jgi:hypothetical protein
MAILDFQTLVTDLVRDDEARSRPAARQRDRSRSCALQRRSPAHEGGRRRGRRRHALALPGTWEYDFSELISIEYPIDQNPPVYLERDTYRLYRKTDGTQEIRFDDALPNANVRLAFTDQACRRGRRHAAGHRADRRSQAVCKLAAADLCDQLAALYSNTQDSTIQADAVQYQNKASQRRSQASAYRKQLPRSPGRGREEEFRPPAWS